MKLDCTWYIDYRWITSSVDRSGRRERVSLIVSEELPRWILFAFRVDSTYRDHRLQIKKWEGRGTGNFAIPFPVVSRKTHSPWRRMIEFYRVYYTVYYFLCTSFDHVATCMRYPYNNTIYYGHARFFHSPWPRPSRGSRQRVACRRSSLTAARQRKLNEIAWSRYRVEKKRKEKKGGKVLTKWCARGMRNADIAAAKIVIAWLYSLQNDEVEKKEGGAEDKEKVKKGGDDRDFLRTIARRSLSLSLSLPPSARHSPLSPVLSTRRARCPAHCWCFKINTRYRVQCDPLSTL